MRQALRSSSIDGVPYVTSSTITSASSTTSRSNATSRSPDSPCRTYTPSRSGSGDSIGTVSGFVVSSCLILSSVASGCSSGGVATEVSQKTRDSYADNVRLHLSPALGEIVLRRLTVAQVDALWSQKRREGYSGNSIRLMRSTLRRGLAQAEKEGLVLRNVAALSGAPRINAKEGRALTVDEAKSLLAALEGHRLEPLVTFMLIFGLRRGEALGLHWREYDRDKRTLRVTHSVKRVQSEPGADTRTQLEIGDLKTKRSRRTLYLSLELVDILRAHRARQAEDQVAAGASWQDHGLIFTTEVGTPLDPDNFSHAFSRLTKEAGLGHWHPHELRHSGASLMLAQGTDLYVVSEVLGHASIAITKDVYGHLVEGHKRTASESMADALLEPHGSQFGSHGVSGAS